MIWYFLEKSHPAPNRYDFQSVYGLLTAQLGGMVRYGEVNQFTKVSQSLPIQFKVLLREEFTILPSQVKEQSDFGTAESEPISLI